MPKTLPEELKTQWRNHINKLVYAYKCTKHDTTGFNSYELMFVWSPRLSINLTAFTWQKSKRFIKEPHEKTTSNYFRTRWQSVKNGLSPSTKICVICFIESPLKMIKNAFYFILKALSFLKIFKFLSWVFGHIEKTAWLKRQG